MLTAAEMAARRDKGLCYNCDEAFVIGHRCRHRISYIMMTEEEELSYLQEVERRIEMEEAQTHAMEEGGATTMRFVVEVDGHELHILIVSGSTLSFLKEDTAKRLGCDMIHDKPLLVRLANGKKLVSTQKAADFKWVVQGNEFTLSPRLLEIEGCDLILGENWLRFCTPVDLDYEQMTLTVTLKGKRVMLHASKEKR